MSSWVTTGEAPPRLSWTCGPVGTRGSAGAAPRLGLTSWTRRVLPSGIHCTSEGPAPAPPRPPPAPTPPPMTALMRTPSIYQGPLPHRLAQCTPDTKLAIEAVARDLAGMGFGIRLSDLFRSHDMQAQSHADFVEGRKKAFSPPPGGSLHEAGRAMDIDLSSIGVSLPQFWEIAKAHGFSPVSYTHL